MTEKAITRIVEQGAPLLIGLIVLIVTEVYGGK